jgi:hypothetical protein
MAFFRRENSHGFATALQGNQYKIQHSPDSGPAWGKLEFKPPGSVMAICGTIAMVTTQVPSENNHGIGSASH